jgi:hypothetical protein
MPLLEDNLADVKNTKKSEIYFFVKTELSHTKVQFVHFYCANVHNGYAINFLCDFRFAYFSMNYHCGE